MKRIVVGLDGSEGSDQAARWCADMAGEVGAEVVAVFGLSPMSELVLSVPPVNRVGRKEEFRSALEDDWCAPLRDAGVSYRAMLVDLAPVEALAKTAEDEGGDVIVVGAQGHGDFTDRLLGGVPFKLVHHADHPVVIVPPPKD